MSLFSRLARRVAKSKLARGVISSAIGKIVPGTSGLIQSKLKSYGAKSKGGRVVANNSKSLETLADREKRRMAEMLAKNPPQMITRNPSTGAIASTPGSSTTSGKSGSGRSKKRKSASASGKKSSSAGSGTKKGTKKSGSGTGSPSPADFDTREDYEAWMKQQGKKIPAKYMGKGKKKAAGGPKVKTKRKGNAKNLNAKYSGVMKSAGAEWRGMSAAEKKAEGSWQAFVKKKLRAVG